MKRIVVPLLIVFMLSMIVGCKKDMTQVESLAPIMSQATNTISDDEIDVTITIGAFSSQSYLFEDEYKADVSSWIEEVKNSYGINFALNYVSPYYSSEFMTGKYLSEAIKEEHLEGLIKLSNLQITNIEKLISEGNILPLNDYVKNNSGFNALPDYIKQPFMINGQLYAIPASNSTFPAFRMINKKILEQTQNEIPQNLEQFYELLGDMSAIENVVPLVIGENTSYVSNLRDIFYASGCYPSFTGYSPISYDPLTKAHEDYLLKPQAKELLLYLSNLFEENLVQMKNIRGFDEFVENDLYGTYYNNMYDFEDYYSENNEIIWYLKGSNEKYLNTIEPSNNAYVLSSNTKNPQETVDSFINTFLLDEGGYYLGYLGQEGVKYEVDGNDIVFTDQYSMSLTGYNNDYFNNQNGFINLNGDRYYENSEMLQSAAEQLLADDWFFTTTKYPYIPYATESGGISRWFLTNFINRQGQGNVDELLTEYRAYAKMYKGPESLKAVNDLYGTTAMYSYGD